MPTTAEKRKRSRERRILRSQSRWLQKALFALSKAEEDDAKLQDLLGDEWDDTQLDVTVDGTEHEISEVTTALKEAVEEWLEVQRTSLREKRALARSA